jgi:hypothetical protein
VDLTVVITVSDELSSNWFKNRAGSGSLASQKPKSSRPLRSQTDHKHAAGGQNTRSGTILVDAVYRCSS